MIGKIKIRQLFLVISFIILLEPAYFSTVTSINNLFLLAKVAVFAIVLFDILRNRMLIIWKEYIPFIVMFAYMFLNTIFHNGFARSTMESISTMICLSVIIGTNVNVHRKELMQALSFVTAMYMIINFATVIMFPNGLYSTYSLYENEYLCWLLGYKNPMSRFILVTLAINMCNSYLQKGKLDWKQYVLGLMGIWSVIRVDSATALVALCLLYIFVLFLGHSRLPKVFNIFNIFVAVGIITFLIYTFNIQERFSYLIVNILHRNLTLTSRVYTWSRAIELIKDSPVFGYGVQTAAKAYQMLKASHPHNYFLYLLYTGGLVGILLTGSVVFTTSRKVASSSNNAVSRICFFALSAILVMGITESLTQMPLLYAMFLLAYCLADGCNVMEENNED